MIESWNGLDYTERFIFNKLIGGSFRIGVSKKLLINALSKYSEIDSSQSVSYTHLDVYKRQVLTTENHRIKAKKIIYCIGYESKSLIKEDFVKLKSTFAVVSEIDEKKLEKFGNTLFWNTDDPYIYMRTTDDARPVSYTHLDVYKRQNLYFLVLVFLGARRF